MKCQVYRTKMGEGWHLPGNAESKTELVFESDAEEAAVRWMKDDMADMTAKWPELGEVSPSKVKGARFWQAGTPNFGLGYEILISE